MADNVDPVTSNLLCPENSNTCFDNSECNTEDEFGISFNQQNDKGRHHCPPWDSHGSVRFPIQSDERVRLMVEREKEHLPRNDYLKRLRSGDLELSVRREALDWILKAHAYYGFGPLSFCLSVNYLDRFLSIHELPRGKSWTVQLLAVACLSLAAKMEEIEVPLLVDLQVGEPKYVFEAKTIERMELLVLSTLRWKMHALTPCSFIDYFLNKLTTGKHPTNSSISRSIQLIVGTIRGIDFLDFMPSEIAAAVAISVAKELQTIEIDKVVSGLMMEEKRVLKCLELIRDLSLTSFSASMSRNLMPLVPQSPDGVLDAACLSYKSDELTVGSYQNSSQNTCNAKRTKSDRPSSDGTFKS
ncbi:cyclin-D4-1-like [Neltuma alba]|uniref:cyclin-D4-1-like n=1 Tax=Neltuma alba TaxID=207710 RepID=UPI0010A556C0|nr:cyclin-D4-1-like [Prosopis alba]XP_028785417.1 cyclin-D4-1-like [Prosopis alba]